VPLEGLSKLKNPITSSGIEPATSRACGIVPQPTALPRALNAPCLNLIINYNFGTVFSKPGKESFTPSLLSGIAFVSS
jgi:hypothetical protein